jgi:hypothetical protein
MPTLLAQWGVDSALTGTTTPLAVPVPQTLPAGTLVVVGIASITTSAPTILVSDSVGTNSWTVQSGRQSAGATSNVTLASCVLVVPLPVGANILIAHNPSMSRHTIAVAAFSDATTPPLTHGASNETTSTAVSGGAISPVDSSVVFGATAFINAGRILTAGTGYTAGVKHLSTAGSGNRGIQLVWRDANPGTYSDIGTLDTGGINLTVLGHVIAGAAQSDWNAYPVKVWTGSAWVTKPSKYWNGTAWVLKPMKVFGPVRAGVTWGKAHWGVDDWDTTDRWGTATWGDDQWEGVVSRWSQTMWDRGPWIGPHAVVPVGACTSVLRESFTDVTEWTGGSITSVAGGRSGNMGQITGSGNAVLALGTPNESAHLTFGMAYKVNSLTSNRPFLQLTSDTNGTNHLTFTVLTDGSVTVQRGGTTGAVIGNSVGGLVPVSSWVYIEAKVFMDETVGSVVVRLNQAEIISVSGIDTRFGGTKTVFDSFKLMGGGTGVTANFDDLYVTVGPDCTFQGDQTITTFIPDWPR